MIITTDQYKALVGIRDNSHDVQIAELIAAVEDDYLRIRNKAFDTDADGATVYPSGSMMAAAEMVSYKLATLGGQVGVASETIGDYSVSLGTDLLYGYPKSTVLKIRRYARLT
jgi:predicted transcriptional regulator